MATPYTCAHDTLVLWSALPEFVQNQDMGNNYLFLTWLDGIGQQLQQIDDLARDDGPNPGWSILLDVSRCPTYALPWLAQLVGTRLNPGLSDEQMRQLILNPPGFGRGTAASITAIGNVFMKPGYSVVVSERDPDPYSVTIEVPIAGLSGMTYAQLAALYPHYSAVDAAFPTYADFTTNTAGITTALLASLPAGIIGVINFY